MESALNNYVQNFSVCHFVCGKNINNNVYLKYNCNNKLFTKHLNVI